MKTKAPDMQQLRTTAGFTMVEMIIVVSVMAVLASVSAPPLVDFMRQRDTRNEEIAQASIRKAISSYIEERKAVPDDTVTDVDDANHWAQQLARYTNMSPAQLRTDEWGRPRTYIAFQSAELILGSTVPIFYATILSPGSDRQADGADNIPVTVAGGVSSFSAPNNNNWWANIGGGQAARITAFTELAAGDDDILIKVTDYSAKIEAYKTTLERMKGIGEALDAYSKAAYAEFSTGCLPPNPACNPTPEQKVYFPRSGNGPEGVADTANLYAGTNGGTGGGVNNGDLGTYNGGASINNTTAANNVTRRTQMINLMRILGLPDEYCCSALESIPGTADADGKPFQMPFYYFSNPRARITAGNNCSARPGANDRKLPARITTRYVNAGGTETPTCG